MRIAAVGALLAITGVACSSGSGPVGGDATTLNGAGATFPAPLYQRWADEYNTAAGVKVNYQAIGSGGGIQQITAKTVDFGASDAPMKDEELTAAPGILHIPTVFGSVAVSFNLEALSDLNLTADVVAGVFMRTIKTWDDPAIAALNPGAHLPTTAITPVHRSDGSGTTNIFTSYLTATVPAWSDKIGSGKEVEWPTDELGGKGNDGVTALLKQTPGAIAYVELVYAQQNELPTAALKNKAGLFVKPTLASTQAAAANANPPQDLRFSIANADGDASYPIAGATWLLVYKDQADKTKGQALVNFLWWALHDGERFAPELGYATLPAALLAKAEAKVKEIAFNGSPLKG